MLELEKKYYYGSEKMCESSYEYEKLKLEERKVIAFEKIANCFVNWSKHGVIDEEEISVGIYQGFEMIKSELEYHR